MHIIGMIIIGFIVGVLAKFLMPGRDGGGFIITTILGILGAVVAAYIGQGMGMYAEGEPAGFIFSVIGAMIVLGVYRVVVGRKV